MGALIMKDDIWMDFVSTRSPELRDEIILAYTPLVRFVVGRLGIPATSMLDAEDLVSYGLIGLINSVDRYDPARGVRFEAFAMSRIRGAVIDQLRVLNWLPRSAVARVRQIESALANLEQRLGRPAKEQEAAAEVGVSTQRYRQMLLEVGIVVLSLDAPLGSLSQEDEVASLGDLLEDSRSLGPDEQTERTELMNALTVAIDHLPERERLLLSLYYHEELTMKEISSLMNVSESRICQLHMQAVLRLRTALNELTIADGTHVDRKLRVTTGGSGGMRRTRRHFSSAAS
ncbi:MAG: FliA/WhiG family RNA polymerase sigma factor [Ktedonobacteraceae bacterium]